MSRRCTYGPLPIKAIMWLFNRPHEWVWGGRGPLWCWRCGEDWR